jgi:signal transduction histidine kinase
LCIPFMVGGAPPLGALAFNTVRGERNWPEELVNRLQLVAQIFANALDRKRTEQALRASEARLVAGADLAGLGYYEANFDDGVMYMDERLRDLCGPPPEVVGLQALEFWMAHLHPDDRPRVMHDRDRLHGGVVDRISTDYRYLHPERGERWFQHVARVGSRDANRHAIGTYGVLRDLTERKRSEDDLRSLSRRLTGAHEEERARLARELHDDLTQRLASLAISLGLLGQAPTGGSATETIGVVRDGLARLSEDVHTLSYRLHPTILEDLGLVEALRVECERFSKLDSVTVEQQMQQISREIPLETALCLFRVTQESLRNVRRHARASTVVVSLCQVDSGLQLTVSDDGLGFDPMDQRHSGHLGLASMRERVDLLSGRFELESAPGKGTTVRVWVPRREGLP